jgi:type II secretion system (T2SS) protein C
MLALLAWLGASIFWALTAPATPEPVVGIEVDPGRTAQAVAARHLFGEAPPPGAAVAQASAPTDIKLQGVIAPTRPGQPAVAVLAIAGKPSVSIREGDDVMPGVRVNRVFAREVELKRDGQIQSLHLPDRLSPPVAQQQPAPPPAAARGSGSRP